MFLCGMRKRSSTGLMEVTKIWFEKGHLHTGLASGPCCWQPFCTPCLCKSSFGMGSPHSFSQASWWSTPGTTTSKASPAVITSFTNTSSPCFLPLCFFLTSSISRTLMWQMLQHCPHFPKSPSSISDFRCVQCLYLGLPHTRAHWCAAQKCT